jgi:hypothetical protein
MNKLDIDKSYVSPYDKFLYGFDATHEPSPAQRKEVEKYQRIFALRDGKEAPNKSDSELF